MQGSLLESLVVLQAPILFCFPLGMSCLCGSSPGGTFSPWWGEAAGHAGVGTPMWVLCPGNCQKVLVGSFDLSNHSVSEQANPPVNTGFLAVCCACWVAVRGLSHRGAAESPGWAGLRSGAGYGAASTEQGEGAWFSSVVFAHASSKVEESLLHATGAEGVELRRGWLCPGAARGFFPAVLCFH